MPPKATEANATGKTARRSTKKGKTIPAEKIRDLDMIDKFSDHQRVPAIATYLGYTDIGQFRRFLLSFSVLEAFVLWKQKAMMCNKFKPAISLIILEPAHSRDSKYPADLAKAMEEYGIPETKGTEEARKSLEASRRTCLLACILRSLVLASSELLQQDDAAKKKAQESATAKTGLGPEHEAEAYNRALTLLKRLQHAIVKIRRESEFFPKKNDSFGVMGMPADAVPTWMLVPEGEEEVLGGPKDGPVDPRPALPPLELQLVEDTRRTCKSEELKEHFEDFLGPNGLPLHTAIDGVPCQRDPRVYPTKQEWLDALRVDLDFVQRRLQFFALNLLLAPASDSSVVTKPIPYPLYGPSLCMNWEQVKKKLSQDQPVQGTLQFNIQPLDEGISPLEFSGVPIQLSNVVTFEAKENYGRQ
ncbi:hypothetical protein IWX90DRAFT_498410 [Phyllosticta citrichinensis]|uniref:Uncharacterized protein n=1 Tax=Phyllosticta citrichinensis TaxID=1130410 RepID=A0ABR1Y513_9PEZI